MRARTLTWIAVLLWLAALLPRFAMLFYFHQINTYRPEPVQIAVNLATKGAFADVYAVPTGYTAHSPPLYPAMLAPIYYFCGDNRASDIIRIVLSTLVAAASYALLPWVSRALGMGAAPGIWAAIVGGLLPVHYFHEVMGWFETPFIVVFLELSVILLARLLDSRSFTLRSALIAGVWSGAGALLTPGVTPVLLGFLLILLWRSPRETWRQTWHWTALALCAAALTIGPWTVRNYVRLGGLFFIRDDFGLELYVSNNDHAVADYETSITTKFFQREHPFTGVAPAMEIKQNGELAFERDRKRRAVEWIRANPRQFLNLTARRIESFWYHSIYGRTQRYFITLFYLVGLAGWVVLWRQNRIAALILGSIPLTYPAIYYVIHNGMRYAHPIFWVQLLLAGQGGTAFLRHYAGHISGIYRFSRKGEGQPGIV